MGASVTEAVQPDQLKHLVDRTTTRVAGPVVDQRLSYSQLALDSDLLEDDPDSVPKPVRCHTRIVAEHLDGARVSTAMTLEDLHRGRLAGPVGSQQGEHLAGLDVERKVVDSPDVAVGLPQPGHGEGGRRGHGGEANHRAFGLPV